MHSTPLRSTSGHRPGARLPLRVLLALPLLGVALVLAEPPDGEEGAEEPRDGGADAEAVERGASLFADTQEEFYPSCAHCHALLPEEQEAKKARHLGPGATLFGSALREGWRNLRTFADVGAASDHCAKRYQERKRGLTQRQKADLTAFLRTRVPEEGKPLPMRKVQRKPKLLEEFGGGDPALGGKLTERYCGGCHSAAERSLAIELKPGKKRKDLIARKVRGFDAQGKFKPGVMSYYANDRLTDQDLLHILAHLGR